MADLPEAGKMADGIHYVVGSLALGFVHDNRAVEGSRLRFAGHEKVSFE